MKYDVSFIFFHLGLPIVTAAFIKKTQQQFEVMFLPCPSLYYVYVYF